MATVWSSVRNLCVWLSTRSPFPTSWHQPESDFDQVHILRLLSCCNVAPWRENDRPFIKQEEELTTVSISYFWRRMTANNKELSKSNRSTLKKKTKKTKANVNEEKLQLLRLWSHLLWPLLMLQTITLHALSFPPCRWCQCREGVQNHNAFLLWNICFLSGGRRAPTCSYIFLSCHIAWQFILGSAGWHLRHKADKALGVTSMRPVGAMTMPLAMQCYKMDNTALHILAK